MIQVIVRSVLAVRSGSFSEAGARKRYVRSSPDSVAKLQKWGATNFPQMDLTSQNRRPMASPGHYRTRL